MLKGPQTIKAFAALARRMNWGEYVLA
jgi:hypothetical protein